MQHPFYVGYGLLLLGLLGLAEYRGWSPLSVNEVKNINRVLFDYTTKPPATIEFE